MPTKKHVFVPKIPRYTPLALMVLVGLNYSFEGVQRKSQPHMAKGFVRHIAEEVCPPTLNLAPAPQV